MDLVMLLFSCIGTEKTQEDTVFITQVEEQQEETAVPEPEFEPESQPEPEEPIEEWDSLTNIQLLTRLSLDLRAVRPSIEELDRIENDPGQLDVLIEEFLADPRFGDQIRNMYDDIYHTDTRAFYLSLQSLAPPDSGFDSTKMRISVGEEPLRIVQKVVEDDLPWTDVVTADWTMADEQLAVFYPIDYPEGETGWKKVQWTDERPAGGVFVTNGFHNRFISQGVNAQRRRANEVSRILLCDNYLGRPIEFSREEGISDQESTQNATQTKAACVSCHVSLDPLASHFWGFQWHSYGVYDQLYYHPSKERYWQDATGQPPAYYGQQSNGLADLGHLIAADPRFSSCAVKQMMEFLFQEDLTLENTATFNHHRDAFLNSGMRMKSLIRSVVHDPLYTASFDNEDASTARLMTDHMIRRSIKELTGYEPRYESIYGDQNILELPTWRVIGGGMNGVTVMSRSRYIHMPMTLLHEQLSSASATYAAFTEHALPVEERKLFIHIDFTESPESHPILFATQIQHLLYAVLGEQVETDSQRVIELISLWSNVFPSQGDYWTVSDDEEQQITSWAVVLAAILNDPTFLIY